MSARLLCKSALSRPASCRIVFGMLDVHISSWLWLLPVGSGLLWIDLAVAGSGLPLLVLLHCFKMVWSRSRRKEHSDDGTMVELVTNLGKVDKQASKHTHTHTHAPSLFATILCLAMAVFDCLKMV